MCDWIPDGDERFVHTRGPVLQKQKNTWVVIYKGRVIKLTKRKTSFDHADKAASILLLKE